MGIGGYIDRKIPMHLWFWTCGSESVSTYMGDMTHQADMNIQESMTQRDAASVNQKSGPFFVASVR